MYQKVSSMISKGRLMPVYAYDYARAHLQKMASSTMDLLVPKSRESETMRAQGTTEYIILVVSLIVVIAVIIKVFTGNMDSLGEALNKSFKNLVDQITTPPLPLDYGSHF